MKYALIISLLLGCAQQHQPRYIITDIKIEPVSNCSYFNGIKLCPKGNV